MADHFPLVYMKQAGRVDRLVSREKVTGNLLKGIRE